MRIAELLVRMEKRLARAGVEEAPLEAALLAGHFLNRSRSELYLAAAEPVPAAAQQPLEAALARRLAREPLAYILGEQEFWSRPFLVEPAVLIPRPETELLVEQALELLADGGGPATVLDLGTGSGMVAVTLALERPAVTVCALDRSLPALGVARRNLSRHRVADQVRLLCSDWLSALAEQAVFDLVVANPPYVAREEWPALQPEVRCHEPRAALDGGPRGLQAIGRLARQIPVVLRPGGWLLMEIGAEQKAAVLALFGASGAYDQLTVLNDLAGRPRLLRGRRRTGG